MDMDPEETVPMYIESCVQGGRQYLMKESPDSLPRARLQLKLMYILDRVCKTVIVGSLCYWTYGLVARLLGV